MLEQFLNIAAHFPKVGLNGHELRHRSLEYRFVELDCVYLLVLVFYFYFQCRTPVCQFGNSGSVSDMLHINRDDKREYHEQLAVIVCKKIFDCSHK